MENNNIENTTNMVVTNEPKKKGKGTKVLVILLLLVILGLGGYIAFDKVLKDKICGETKECPKCKECTKCKETSVTDDKTSINNNDNSSTNQTNSTSTTKTNKDYVGDYGLEYAVFDTDTGEFAFPAKNELHLRSDNTFRYYVGGNAYTPITGTYEVKNNKIILTKKIAYGSDESYTKINGTIIIDIFSDNVLGTNDRTMNFDSKTIYFIKGEIEPETADDKEYYSANPVDGQKAGKHTWSEN